MLILGGNGMIGHRIWLASQSDHDTWVTLRASLTGQPWAPLFSPDRVVEGVTADDPGSFDRAFEIARPDVVINALGLIKQRPDGASAAAAYEANCFVPHYVRRLCDRAGARLIQISTDCVFVGDRGNYTEDDVPDAVDAYGLTKRLGEVGAPHLTLRFSAIGRSLRGSEGLLEWFLAQSGTVRGFRSVLFSGVVADELASTVLQVVDRHPDLSGVWHVAAPAIDKCTLLEQLRDAFAHDVEIVPVDEPVLDRTLDDSRFRAATGIPKPDWEGMISRLAADSTPYDVLRGPA